MPLTCAYCPVPGAPDVQSVAVTVCSSRRQRSDEVQTPPSYRTHRRCRQRGRPAIAGPDARALALGLWERELASQVADGTGPGGELGGAAECPEFERHQQVTLQRGEPLRGGREVGEVAG